MSSNADVPPDRRASDYDARMRVDFAAPAAQATPLAELGPTTRDLTRVQPLLEQLAGAVASLLSADMAIVWTADPSEDQLLPSAWVGFPDEYIAPLRVPYGTGSAGRAVLERVTVLVEDIATSEHYGAYARGALEHGVRTALSVPMLTLGGAPMGALTTYYRSTFTPDQRDLEVAGVYARQAAEIVERARLHAEARQLAALEQRRSAQLNALAQSSLALSAAESLDELLRLVTDAAVDVIGCHQGVTSRVPGAGWAEASSYVALSEAYAQWRGYREVPRGLGLTSAVCRDNRPLRLTGEQMLEHPDFRRLRDAPGHPPLPDFLAAPLVGRDGSNVGLIQLSHKKDLTPFTAEDEAILVQLAQMASSTVERLEAFEGERQARREAERAALLRGVLSDASGVFAESFDPRAIGAALVQLVVPRLATVSVLHLVDDAGELVMDACSTADPERLSAARACFGAPVLLDAPYGPAAVLRTGQPRVAGRLPPEVLASVTRTDARAAELAEVLDDHTMSLPLMARGRTLGVLTLSRDAPYDDGDLDHALDLSRRAALALDNASRYAFERDVAVTLQHSLLPRALTGREGLTAAARYLPGARGTRVGGDWYDVLEVDGKVVLVVGDVMGRGIEAAAVMGQLRATVRAYALEGHPPAEVLTRLDQVVLMLTGLNFSTCLVAVLDPVSRLLCVACAGHLPPVVVAPGGPPTVLDVDPGLPLGVGGGTFVQQTVQLPPGALVVLYTDGLVETRDASLQEGIDRLLDALAEPVASAEQACARVLEAQGLHGDQDDDTAVLVVLLDPLAEDGPPVGGSTPLELVLTSRPESASAARSALRDLLEPYQLDLDAALLLLSELVGNAVRHAGAGEIVVRAQVASGRLRVEVVDVSPVLPDAPALPPLDAEGGRGLLLVDALADRWGAHLGAEGKCLWFELAASPAPPASEDAGGAGPEDPG